MHAIQNALIGVGVKTSQTYREDFSFQAAINEPCYQFQLIGEAVVLVGFSIFPFLKGFLYSL